MMHVKKKIWLCPYTKSRQKEGLEAHQGAILLSLSKRSQDFTTELKSGWPVGFPVGIRGTRTKKNDFMIIRLHNTLSREALLHPCYRWRNLGHGEVIFPPKATQSARDENEVKKQKLWVISPQHKP